MKISFQIEYRTQWGEELRVLFADGQTFALQTHDGTTWRNSIDIDPLHIASEISYRYALYRNNVCIRKEWNGVKRRLTVNLAYSHLILNDAWRDRSEDTYFYSSAFSGSDDRHYPTGTETNHDRSLLLKVRCPRMRSKTRKLAVSGNQECLGNWDMTKPKIMHPCGANEWCILLDAQDISYPFEYKFLAWDSENNKEGEWMIGNNRCITSLPLKSGELLVISDDEVHFDLPAWKAAGVAIPVFSLRSETSYGVGDFGDLKKFIDWAAMTGMKAVQILPINDTTITHTWTDSYPYSSISIYAFHPMYIDINQLEELKDEKLKNEYEEKRIRLNALPQVDYEEVNQLKLGYLHALFEQNGETVLHSIEYLHFYEDNKEWLQPYGVFCYLRDLYGTSQFQQWPEHSSYQANDIEHLYATDKECKKETDFYYYLQFILHTQLIETSQYAHSRI